jgi:aspartyl-tRNA(Asn)/glutamyl-tRNA(Gln) amidotransferase subunit A
MQIIGDCFKEKNIIRAAYTFEQAKNSYDRCDVAKARD